MNKAGLVMTRRLPRTRESELPNGCDAPPLATAGLGYWWRPRLAGLLLGPGLSVAKPAESNESRVEKRVALRLTMHRTP